MNPDIVQLKEEDYADLMKFLDRGFAPDACAFDTLLPARFTDRKTGTACNYAIRDNGRMIAAAGVYPIDWRVGEVVIRVAGIGNVAVDPEHRGRGLMSQLMRHVVTIAPQLGYDLTWLGGYRQRYATFGYEKAGVLQQFFVTRANIRAIEAKQPEIGVRSIKPANEPVSVAMLKALYDQQIVRCERTAEAFPLHLQNWRRVTWMAERPDGSPAGYAVANTDGKGVTEIIAANRNAAESLISHLVGATTHESVEFQLPPHPSIAGTVLSEIAEHRFLTTSGNWLIYNWPKLIQALLAVQHGRGRLANGSTVLGIAGQPANLKLCADSTGVHCDWTDQNPDFSGDSFAITRTLLGPARPSLTASLRGPATILDAWCPLAAGFGPQDYV